MFSVTEKAKSRIQEIRIKEGKTEGETVVRVGVTSGGCSGLSYALEFDARSGPNDQAFEENGIKIIMEKKSVLYLIGTTLDFSDGLTGKGFYFINPNASRTCACGESFAV